MVRRINRSPKSSPHHSGQALIGLLAAVAIMLVLYLAFLGPRSSKDGEHRKSVAAESIDQGKEVALTSNLQQIRQGISMYRQDNEGRVPASMEELRRYLKDYPAEMWVNPIDNSPLIYDPATGSIYAQGEHAPGRRWDMNKRDPNIMGDATPAPPLAAPGAPAPLAAPPPPDSGSPYGGVPGVPNPSDITSRIPQPGGNIGSEGGGEQ